MKVSVLLPAYNSGDFLSESVESVLNQTHRDLELLIYDDASTDDTLERAQRYAAVDSRVKVIKGARNLGCGGACRHLLEAASGEYLALIGHDDVYLPEHLSRCLARLEAEPGSSACFSQVSLLDSRPSSQKSQTIPNPFAHRLIDDLSHAELARRLYKGNFLCAASSVSRAKFLKGWSFLGDNDTHQDWSQWQHLILQGPFLSVSEVGVRYRVHGDNLSLGEHLMYQLTSEMALPRFQMLSSSAFSNHIMNQPDPAHEFDLWCRVAREGFTDAASVEAQILYISLELLREKLGHLSTYAPNVAFALWDVGQVSKAVRGLAQANADQLENYLSKRAWCWMMVFKASPHLKNQFWVSPAGRNLIVARKIPGLQWIKIRSLRPVPRFSFVTRRTGALERELENLIFRREFVSLGRLALRSIKAYVKRLQKAVKVRR